MAIVIIAPTKKNLSEWKAGIQEALQQQGITDTVWLQDEVERPEKVRMAITWKHPHESLYAYSNLEVVASMGAGVDHILSDPNLPKQLQLTRIIDPLLSQSMSNYLLAVVLEQHKKLSRYKTLQQTKHWGYTDEPEFPVSVGILGMGVLGEDFGKKLVSLGFPVHGFSQTPKKIDGIKSYVGEQELDAFLQEINVLICLLPLTQETQDFLYFSLFRRCRKGTYLINVARGEHLVEEDLIRALDENLLSGATLDVFRQEPLPQDHPFWERPEITITPHIASITKLKAAIPQLAENYRHLIQGKSLNRTINRKKGY